MSSRTETESTMHAVVAHAKDDVRVEARTIPVPRPDEALVRIAYGGICGSDLHYWRHGAAGESVLKAPMVLGHEVVGVVEKASADGSGPEVGTPVAVHPATPHPGDGTRYPHDRPNLSPGCTYLGSAAQYPHTDGAFSTYVALPTRMLRALPDALDLRVAAIIEPASVAWHAVTRAGDIRRKRIFVVGSGPIGALIVAVARAKGAAEIIASDMHESALAVARTVGAHRTVHATDTETIAALDADIVFESSGSARGLASAVRAATRGGRIVMVGLLPSGEQPALLSLSIVRELELVGSFRFNDEIDDVIAALANGTLDVTGVVTHEYDAVDALDALEIASDPSRSGKVLLKF